jgi:hypothetical protein
MKMEAKKWTYEAIRQNGIVTATIKLEAEPGCVEYFPLHHFVLHSPSGFEMGFGSSGPADLAHFMGIDRYVTARRLPDLERTGQAEKGNARMCTVTGRNCVTWWVK